MTGADVKRQVMEALGPFTTGSNAKLSRAFVPCIVLTAEEAATVRAVVDTRAVTAINALALLTPDQEASEYRRVVKRTGSLLPPPESLPDQEASDE